MAKPADGTPRGCSTCCLRRGMPVASWPAWMRRRSWPSRLHQNAVIRALEVIGEAAGKVSPAFRAAQPAIPWREITGLRHRLIHGCDEVRLDVVWRVVAERLDPLIVALEPLIRQEGASDA